MDSSCTAIFIFVETIYRTRRNRGRSNLIWTTLILVMSLQVILIMLPNLSFAQEVQNEHINNSPQIALVPGIQILSIFSVSVIIPLIAVPRFRRKGSKRILAPNKFTIIILLLLFASLLLVVFNPGVIEYSIGIMRQISDSVATHLTESALYALGLGILTSFLAIRLFSQSELLSDPTFDQKLLLKIPIVLFTMLLITIGAIPIVLISTAGPGLLNYDIKDLNSQVIVPLLDFVQNGISGLIVFLLSYTFSIWIPSASLMIVIYEVRSSVLKLWIKIGLISISFSLFVAMAIWNILGLFMPVLDKFSYASILLGPTIAAVLLSFLAAEGYIDVIRKSFNRLKTSSAASARDGGERYFTKMTRKNILKEIGSKVFAIIVLIITIIGLSRNLFLLTIPFLYVDFPLGYSLVYDFFIKTVSDYTFSVNPSQGLLPAASNIYDSFIIFFSVFWIYDIIMIFRAFGEDFLNPENLIYKKLRKCVGQLTALSFLSIIILFTVQESSFSFRVNEMNAALPTWVRQELGIQNYEVRFLSESLITAWSSYGDRNPHRYNICHN